MSKIDCLTIGFVSGMLFFLGVGIMMSGPNEKTFCHTATNTIYFEATKTPVFNMDGSIASCDVDVVESAEREGVK